MPEYGLLASNADELKDLYVLFICSIQKAMVLWPVSCSFVCESDLKHFGEVGISRLIAVLIPFKSYEEAVKHLKLLHS